MSLVVAGATGFIGQALGARLARTRPAEERVGLTRGRRDEPGVWSRLTACDLFSLKDTEEALHGARAAVYLVHSMSPSARHLQGSFADLDLICADNFGRAARSAGVEQIVYVGGLVPPGEALSPHLASRLEVEGALAAHDVPVTTLRAGMVVGPGGSSLEIMARLVRRLPVMLLPRWTRSRCQPIDVDTLVALIDYVLDRREDFGKVHDVGGPDVLSYREMMAETAAQLGLRRRSASVPVLSPGFSRLWISLITGAPKALVQPLIQSLRHQMVAGDRELQARAGLPGMRFAESLRAALGGAPTPVAYRAAPGVRHAGVRSVQRIPIPPGRDAAWAAAEYMRWLPRALRPLLRVDVDGERHARFSLAGSRRPLLDLRFAPDRSREDRQLFYIVGGRLAAPTQRGRLEFRVAPDGEHLLTAIHDYVPTLPWWIYRFTQLVFHGWVMSAFGRHLQALT